LILTAKENTGRKDRARSDERSLATFGDVLGHSQGGKKCEERDAQHLGCLNEL
jgi:hypothetical protein